MRKFEIVIATLFLAALLSGCASTHNLAAGERAAFGGGVATRAVLPGLFYINVQTNATPLPNYAGARSLWTDQAAVACQNSGYTEAMTDVHDTDFLQPLFGLIPYKIASKSGYCICAIHQLSVRDIAALSDGTFEE